MYDEESETEVTINDEDNEEHGDVRADGSEQGEQRDRGDVVTPTDEDATEDQDGPEGEEGPDEGSADEEPDDGEEGEESADKEVPPPGVPAARVGEIAREKSALRAISDALVDGSLDPEVVRDIGGSSALAKAVVVGQISLDALKSDKPVQPAQPQKEPENIENMWAEYHRLSENLKDDEAKTQLLKIRRAEREETQRLIDEGIARARAEDARQQTLSAARQVAAEIKETYPVLRDPDSRIYKAFTILADGLHADGLSLPDSLRRAAEDLLGSPPEQKAPAGEERTRVAAERKKQAVLKKAKAAAQQPPQLDTGSGNRAAAAAKSVENMTEEEFDSLSEQEKRRLRGD